MAKLNEYQRDQRRYERSLEVHKRDDMIQKARFRLSVQEQRAVLFAISKIKPTDDVFTEYEFDIKDFYSVCGIEKDTYTELKKMLLELKNRSWWAVTDDKGTESTISWFNKVRTNKKSGKVTIRFDDDMMPYLLNLVDSNSFYTSYNLKYILPMTSKHSPRLYEILKSYQKNNQKWYFEIDKLKKLLDCENYKRWPDFRRYVLDPAVEEINKYTDIYIEYQVKKEGRKVSIVEFFMDSKTRSEEFEAEQNIEIALDGQLSLFDRIQDVNESIGLNFYKERRKAHAED